MKAATCGVQMALIAINVEHSICPGWQLPEQAIFLRGRCPGGSCPVVVIQVAAVLEPARAVM